MSKFSQPQQSAKAMARIAGLSYVIYSAAGLYITFGPAPALSRLAGPGLLSPELSLFLRLDLLVEALLYTAVAVSAAAMFVVLRTVSLGAAAVGAFCRLAEAAMGASFIIFKYAAFAAATNRDLLDAFSEAERGALIGFLGQIHSSAIYFLLIPMALGGVLFFSLFCRSRLIPRWLSAWGVLTYTIVGSAAATVLLVPHLGDRIMLVFLPGALFEWCAGLWLLLAGIKASNLKG